MSETFAKCPHGLLQRKDVSAAAKLVWIVLRDRQGRNGTAWPSITTLMQDVGMGRHSVLRAVNELERKRLLLAHRRGNGKANTYTIQTGAESAPVLDKSWVSTGAESAPVLDKSWVSTGAESAPVRKGKWCRKRTTGSAHVRTGTSAHVRTVTRTDQLNQNNPPLPPQGGEPVSALGRQTAEDKTEAGQLAPPRPRRRMTRFEATVERFRRQGIEERLKAEEGKSETARDA